MPPRPDPMNQGGRGGRGGGGVANPDIAQLVAEQLMAAIPNIVMQVTAGMNAHGNAGTGGGANGTQGCSYKSFMTCKPKEFHGKEGAVGLIKWIENIETVLHISGCAEGNKVEFASCQLQDRAMTWWKTQVQIRGREAAYMLTWEEFTNLLMEEYYSKDERQKLESEFWSLSMNGSDIEGYTVRFQELARLVPHMVTPEDKRIDRYIWGLAPSIRGLVTSANLTTIQSAVVLANRLTSDLIRSGALTKNQSGDKRKAETQTEKKASGNNKKNQKTIKNFAATTQGAGTYAGSNPKCNKCNLHHKGDCPTCGKCNKKGHFTKYCRIELGNKEGGNEGGNRGGNREGVRVCYECGNPDHFRNRCPKLNR